MCSVYGAVGTPDPEVFRTLRDAAGDRGRDGGRWEEFPCGDGVALLGNWRAAPTPEAAEAPLQPYGALVHNGTIANDKELGAVAGEVDSMVLPRVLDRSSIYALAKSLGAVRGSFAIATMRADSGAVLLAANYKPLHYWSPDGVTVYFSSLARHFDAVCPPGQAPKQLSPYSVLDLSTWESVALPRALPKRAVVSASAGLDSTVVAASLISEGYDVCLLHFSYGCLAGSREAEAIPRIANALGCSYEVRQIDAYRATPRASTLFGDGNAIVGGVEGAEYAHEWVPARNLVLLAHTVAYAEAHGYGYVALGNNLEEAGAYPDNEEQFTLTFDALLDYAVQANTEVRVITPVANLMKREIVELGLRVGAPLNLTWSCYRGGEAHCGECGPCFMRREAFRRAGREDPVFGGAA